MLNLPKEMVILSQTGLTLVVAKGEGHSPIKSIGVVLCHLPHICHQTVPSRPQIWNLSVRQKAEDRIEDFLERLAHGEKTTVQGLIQAYRLSPAELQKRSES